MNIRMNIRIRIRTYIFVIVTMEALVEQALQHVSSNDPSVSAVDWYGYGVDDGPVQRLALALHGNRHVRTLELSENTSITNTGVCELIQALPQCVVEEVSLLGTSVSEELVEEISELCHAKHRQAAERLLFDLVGRPAAAAAAATASNEDELAATIARAAADDPTLRAVDWYHRSVNDISLHSLAGVLHGNRHVRTLELSENEVTDVGVASLVQVLPHCAVDDVRMHGNRVTEQNQLRIGQLCLDARIRRVKANDPSMENVDFQNTIVAGDAAVAALAENLRGNQYVRMISLGESTTLTDIGATALEQALPFCAVEDVQYLGFSGVSESKRVLIKRLCSVNILRLRIALNDATLGATRLYIDDTLVPELVVALRNNTNLLSLHLVCDAQGAAGSTLTDTGVARIEEALPYRCLSILSHLYLGYDYTDRCAHAITYFEINGCMMIRTPLGTAV